MSDTPRLLLPPASHFFLLGPRGTGKSTWLKQAFPDALSIDLLDPERERTLTARPELLGEQVAALPSRRVVILDEIQRVPSLLTVVHSLIERKAGHRFVLTGSSARKLRRSGVDLLGGRAARCSMHPFLAAELGSSFDLPRALRIGLVPGIMMATEPEQTLRAYAGLYLREEIKAEGLVRNLASFSRFMEAMSLSQGQPLNLANVSRECEVSRATVTGYLEVLEDMLLSFRLPIFTRRAKRLLAAHPKFYWFDAGVFRSVRPSGPLDQPESIEGAAVESLVAQHLRGWIDYGDSDMMLSYWRTKSGSEVDFVIYGREGFWAIEVKNGRKVAQSDLRGLAAFHEDYPMAKRVLVYRGRERLRRDGVLCIPLVEFLLQIRPGHELPS
ncbi:MAG: ATP-binding protein [Planctomycetota bacterium]